MKDPAMDGLPEEPPPSPESFGNLYKLLGSSPTYRQILADVHGPIYGLQLSVAGPVEIRLLANRAGLAPGQRVADLACGMGGGTVHMAAEYGGQVIAVDWSRQALAICRQSAEAAGVAAHMRFLVGDITRPVFAEESLHAVVSIDGFYFGVDLPWLYGEVFRILRPGGRFAFYFNVPSQAVVEASSASRREHRESHRIDHQAALHQAGFVQVRAEERTFNEQRLLSRFLAAYTTRFDALGAEIGPDVATDLREEIAQTLVMTEHGQWPRYLFSARKPVERVIRRR